MIVWLFTSIWHALLGLVLLVTFFGGAVIVLARAIAKSTEHDQTKCECVDCQRRRALATEKRWANKRWGEKDQKRDPQWSNDTPRRTNELWISTLELIGPMHGPGTRVGVKGVMYEFKEVDIRNGKWHIYLTRLSDKQRTIVTVKYEAGHRRYWKLGTRWFS